MPRQTDGVSFTPQWNFLGTGDTSTVQIYNSLNGTYSLMLTYPLGDLRYQPLNAKLTAIAALANSAGVLTNNGSGVFSYTPAASGTVTSVAALTLGTTGTDLSSSVANSTTTPVITLNVPTASATNRGVLSSADWTTFNDKLSTSGTAANSTLWNNVPLYTTSEYSSGTISSMLLYNLTNSRVEFGNVSTIGTWLNLNTGATLTNSISGNAGTVTNGVYTTGSYSNPSWITGIPYSILTGTTPTWNQNTTGSAATLTTTRTIWGQNFNGSGNVSGALTGVTDITASGNITGANLAISNWNTAYTNRITSLTTTGSSGAATLISNTLNIPTYTASGLGAALLSGGNSFSGNQSINGNVSANDGTNGLVLRPHTSGSGRYAIYPNTVTPSNSNMSIYFDGANETFLNGASATGLLVGNTGIVVATSTGVSVTGDLGVTGSGTFGSGLDGLKIQPHTSGPSTGVAIYSTNVTPGNNNYSFMFDDDIVRVNGASQVDFRVNNNAIAVATASEFEIYSGKNLIIQSGLLSMGGTPVYADNSAAVSGGLTTGTVYRTSTGQLMIVY